MLFSGSATYAFSELEQKYNHFYAPEVQVLVNDTNLVQAGVAVTDVHVVSSVDSSDSLTFTVTNAFDPVTRQFQWIDDFFTLGTLVEVMMGYGTTLQSVFYGLITSIDFDYPADGAPVLTIHGMDMSYLMMNGTNSNSWTDYTVSQVVSEVGSKYLSDLHITGTDVQFDTIPLFAKDDFQFLKGLADQFNYDFFISGRSLYFRDPFANATPITTLEWGGNLYRLSPSLDISAQVNEFVVRAVTQSGDAPIEAVSSPVNTLIAGSSIFSSVLSQFGSKKRKYVYRALDSAQEAQALADALLNRQVMQLISGDGECVGVPEIMAGNYIQLAGVGSMFSQPVYLHTVTHSINESGYTTSFSFGGNKGIVDSLTKPSVAGQSSATSSSGEGASSGGTGVDGKVGGVMRGTVTNNQDPQNLGRVKVTYKVMEEERETDWVRVATLMTGSNFGSLFIPDVGEEVLVAFHMGELREPYVIGSLWNQTSKPPQAIDDATGAAGGAEDAEAGAEEAEEGASEAESGISEAEQAEGSLSSAEGDLDEEAGGLSAEGEAASGEAEAAEEEAESEAVEEELAEGEAEQAFTNTIRMIRSRSGHELLFDDTEEMGALALKTNQGNKLVLQDGVNSIKITDATGTNTMEILADEGIITIKNAVGASVTLTEEGTVSVTGIEAISMSAATITLEAEGEMTLSAGADLNIASEGIVTINGDLVQINL